MRGETLRLEGVHLRTPDDFDKRRPGEPILSLTAASTPPDFGSIQRITLRPLTTQWLGSRPDSIECYSLGSLRDALPPPPDWKRAFNQTPPWQRAQALRDASALPFLNHAIFCWTGDSRAADRGADIYLFRQNFRIERPETVIRATLRLAGNIEPQEAAFNECPLHLGNPKQFSIGEFEVTPLLRRGDNILALKVVERPGVPQANYGLAFHLELTRRDESTRAPDIDPRITLVTNGEGDRLWGWIRDLNGDRVVFDTTYGVYSTDWDTCTGILFPGGWRYGPLARSYTDRYALTGPDATPAIQLFGLPLATKPQPLQDCLLLTDGRMTTARPQYVKRESQTLTFDGSDGKQYSLPMNQVLGIYPPRPVNQAFRRPQQQTAVLYCRLITTAGEAIGGLLRELNSERALIETAGGQILPIKTAWVATIDFPYHAATLGPEVRKRGVGLIPLAGTQDAYSDVWNADARHVQASSFAIGADCQTLALDALADTNRLRPELFPALVSIDPLGQYLQSFKMEGDAQAALVSYIEDGGVLIALSRGGALRSPVKNDGGQLVAVQNGTGLVEKLGLRTLHPSDPALPGIVTFDHPPNTVEEIFFQRSSQIPKGLNGLPRRIEMAPMTQAPYYPMVSRAGRGLIVYELFDQTGLSYGPALTILPRGRGWLAIVDHLLWESRLDDRPFSERVLPILLGWALSGPER